MRRAICFLSVFALVFACKKPVSDLEVTPTLDVEQKNMGVRGVRSATWCSVCGAGLNNTQNILELNKIQSVGMVFKDAFSGEFGAHSDWGNNLFDKVAAQFGLPTSVPTSFQNFNHNSVQEHVEGQTVVNGNYEIDFNGNEMIVRTTTKFFTQFEGDVYLAPFVIVDNLVGAQIGHPQTPNTVHTRYVADVAYPINKDEESKFEWGYLISSGIVRDGHTVNTVFKTNKKPHWSNNNVSIGLVYFRKVGNEFIFINAFTKY
jgi:hypothetical protein